MRWVLALPLVLAGALPVGCRDHDAPEPSASATETAPEPQADAGGVIDTGADAAEASPPLPAGLVIEDLVTGAGPGCPEGAAVTVEVICHSVG